jgi:formate dehydrogenase subunit gamma
MEGAFEAMGSGTVDTNWAKQHHSLWLADKEAKGQIKGGAPPAAGHMQPAE